MGGGSSKTKKVDPALNSVLPPSASTALPNVPEPESKPKNSWHHILSYDPTYLVEFPPTGSFGIELMSPIPGDQRVYVKKLIPDGFAVTNGNIRNGDMLCKINEIDVSLYNMAETMNTLRECSKDNTEKRILGFYSRDNLELYEVTMSKKPEAGPFGARIINSRYGSDNIAVVCSVVKKGGQAEKNGVLAGDSILKIGTEHIHNGGRAGSIIKDAQSDTLILYMCRGMKMGARDNGSRIHLSSETAEESKKIDEEFTEFVMQDDYIQDLQSSMIDELQNETDKSEAALREKMNKQKSQMSTRVQERLQGRKMLKESPESLKKTDLFNDLTNEMIAAIVDAMQFKTIASGQNLMTQGEYGDSLMVILKGTASVLHDGKEVKKLKDLDVLGEGSLCAGDHVRGATVLASTKLHVLVLTREQFNVLSSTNILPPSISEKAKAMATKYENQDEERLKELMEGRNKYTVSYNKGTLGMKLVCLSQKDSRVFVKSIVAGGQSEANGQVLAGHQILKIALQDVTKLSLEKVLQILSTTKKPVDITFAADDVSGIGKEDEKSDSSVSNDWISCMADGEDESNLTFAEITKNNEEIVANIQKDNEKYAAIQNEKREKQKQKMANRVQERLKARASIKSNKTLSKCKMFESFNSEILSKIVDSMTYRKILSGQNIVTQGDDAQEMVCLFFINIYCCFSGQLFSLTTDNYFYFVFFF